jgi:starch phosphorylase
MDRVTKLPDGGFLYSATIDSPRDANDFTPRVVPYHRYASIPLEASQIIWQK